MFMTGVLYAPFAVLRYIYFLSKLPSVIDRSHLSPSRESKRRGDKFDRSMTRGKLLGNNAQLFIFISMLKMTQLISFFTLFAYCSLDGKAWLNAN